MDHVRRYCNFCRGQFRWFLRHAPNSSMNRAKAFQKSRWYINPLRAQRVCFGRIGAAVQMSGSKLVLIL